MEKGILERIDQLGAKLVELGGQIGPQAWDVALTTARAQAASQLLGAFVALSLCGAFVYTVKRILQWLRRAWQSTEDEDVFLRGSTVAVLVAGGIIAVVLGVNSVLVLTDAFLWFGVFDPRVILAKKALGL